MGRASRRERANGSAAGSNLATVSASGLSAGASVSQSATVTAPSTAGTYYVWVIADNNSTAGQTGSTANNDILLAGGILTVTSAAASSPDLVIQNISYSPSSVTAGGSVSVSWTLRNQGSGAAS